MRCTGFKNINIILNIYKKFQKNIVLHDIQSLNVIDVRKQTFSKNKIFLSF